MNREKALDSIFAAVKPQDVIVSTTGLISREIFERFDSERNVYLPGSMGLVSSVGLGMALSLPGKRIVVIDGDASLLMNLGSLVTIGNRKPANLIHVVLDNGSYGSCSEEASMSSTANLDALAFKAGYRTVETVDGASALERAILFFADGPGFILAKIILGGRRDFIRPLKLVEMRERFSRFLSR